MIDDWDNDVTTTHFGLNYFQGSNGSLGDSIPTLSSDSKSPVGSSLHLKEVAGEPGFGGFFTTLFGRRVCRCPSDRSRSEFDVEFARYLQRIRTVRGIECVAGEQERRATEIRNQAQHGRKPEIQGQEDEEEDD